MTLKVYRPKPQEIHAMQLTVDNVDEIVGWCGGRAVVETDPATDEQQPGVNIPTVSGNVRVSLGQYVVRNERGRFSKYTQYDFERQFEIATRI